MGQHCAFQGVMGVKKIVRRNEGARGEVKMEVKPVEKTIVKPVVKQGVAIPDVKFGKTPKTLPDETLKKCLHAASLGIPEERIAILAGYHGNAGGWQRLLARNPEFARDLYRLRVEGEVNMVDRVGHAREGWQGSAWILERTRGYVARQSLEHSGPGGKSLTIAHQVLAVVNPLERG